MKPNYSNAARILTRADLASVAIACGLGLFSAMASAQTPLADGPLFSSNSVPGNLALALSVEYPTGISVAHTNRTYANTTEYLGFFDPSKCYDYRYTNGTSTDNYFYPNAVAAANHICSSKWSGNFLNWASMQTIDPFRWVLTGGYRVIDQAALTVIEKAWGTTQGSKSNFPDSSIDSSMLAGATPFPASAVALYTRIWGLGNKMRFTLPSGGQNFTGQYYNNTSFSGSPALTRTDAAIDFDWGTGSPGAGVNADNFSVQWTGNVTAPSNGDYKFQIKADDTLELWVDGVRIINQTSYQSNTYQVSSKINTSAGHVFSIVVKMVEFSGGAGAQLQWKKPSDSSYSTIGSPVVASLDGATATAYNPTSGATAGTVYEVFMRAKVCDPQAPGGVEANCTAYGTNWKPEGLMQKYANRIRYSALGYLNDSSISRDGGVIRAQMKFTGPTQPVPGSVPVVNAPGAVPGQTTGAEWSATDGTFTLNPDAADATNTATIMGLASGAVTNSGVMNYLNKFGQASQSYKTYDNVSELYYAAIRYFKNLPNVPEWTATNGNSQATVSGWVDGFPVITSPPDPILYSCQRNFILGIGDANTHADKNVPGNTITTNEPTMPPLVAANATGVDGVNAVDATNKVGVLENIGGGSLGTVNSYNGCCNNNSTLIAGLAYDAHIKDIRGRTAAQISAPQTIDTYWVDVQEYQQYKDYNQFYLATKYGGFTVPTGYSYTNTTALPTASWHTTNDTLSTNNLRPDNYYSGGQPDLMKTGLEAAFAAIASKIKAYTTSFSTSLPQVVQAGNASYSSLYDASSWTGEIIASDLSFDASTGAPSLTEKWKFTDKLATQLAGTGWQTNRRIATWSGSAGEQFCTGTGCTLPITAAQLSALDPSYVSGVDSANYLNYLRGDTTNERASTAAGSTKAYRTRAKLLGDIVGSKARPVGPPAYPFSDAANPGYSAFKATWAGRPTVVYVGANDGMMHAIHGDLTTGGTELFAYVPSALFQGPNGTPSVDGLASLGNPSFSHHFLVNATPNVYDVDFARTAGASGSADWHSILIGGLGKGGRSYYAIDVTDPVGMAAGGEATVAGKVLWEFTDTDLGYTYGDPIVVKTAKYGWVVIIPSGYNNTDGQGHLLIINPKTGALLEKVSTGAGSPTNSAGLAFANAFVLDSSDGTIDAVYAGDLLGNLWRWDVTPTAGAYPAPLKMATLTTSGGSAQPVTSRPMIEVHPTLKKRFVLVGTGRLLDTTDIANTQGQSFYAIVDGTNAHFNASADLPSGITFPVTRSMLATNTNALVGVTFDPTTQMGWVEDLGVGANGIGWRVTTDATTLLGSVAWAATLPNGSVCSPSGDSRVYGRDFASSITTVKTLNGANLESALYVSISGNVTDLRYLSVNGKATLISGTDIGGVQKIDITPVSGLGLRRLNWRELQTAD